MPPHEGRYGVVVCPKCRHAKGVDLGAATTSCGRCGSRHTTRKLRVFWATDDAEALREAVGTLEAKVAGKTVGLIEVEALAEEIAIKAEARHAKAQPRSPGEGEDVIAYAASRAAGMGSITRRIDALLDALDEHGPPEGFTEAMVEDAFAAAGLPTERVERELRRAITADELYEPRPGRLKRL